jgi:hypothetical protein
MCRVLCLGGRVPDTNTSTGASLLGLKDNHLLGLTSIVVPVDHALQVDNAPGQ